MKVIKEQSIERYLVKRVKALGGEIRKVKWIGRRGAPDRLVLMPTKPAYARARWVELKSPTGSLSSAQIREHARLRECGQSVYTLSSKEAVDRFLGIGPCPL